MEGVNDIKDFLRYFEEYSQTKKNDTSIERTIEPLNSVSLETNVINKLATTEVVEHVAIPNIIEMSTSVIDIVQEAVSIPQQKEVSIIENDFYKIYRDKAENFNCEISVEGATIDTTTVRLLFITEEWNVFIDGTIDKDGNVSIPIKKMSLFKEGTSGTLKMEVVADNTLFVPWETEFEIKESKKVLVTFNENRQIKDSKAVNVRMK
jgi:hypothetical protein